jgi:hypothetical protein
VALLSWSQTKTTPLGAAEDIVGMESIIIQRFTVGEMREERKVSRWCRQWRQIKTGRIAAIK